MKRLNPLGRRVGKRKNGRSDRVSSAVPRAPLRACGAGKKALAAHSSASIEEGSTRQSNAKRRLGK